MHTHDVRKTAFLWSKIWQPKYAWNETGRRRSRRLSFFFFLTELRTKKALVLNKVFLPSPFLSGVAALLCLFKLHNISVGHPSLHPSKNTQSGSQVQALDQRRHCVLQMLSAAPGTARDGKYTQANSSSVDTHSVSALSYSSTAAESLKLLVCALIFKVASDGFLRSHQF